MNLLMDRNDKALTSPILKVKLISTRICQMMVESNCKLLSVWCANCTGLCSNQAVV